MTKIKPETAAIGGLIAVVAYIYLKGRGSTKATPTANTSATSVANATNLPNSPVTSMGHEFTQPIPTNQLTPNEPGTAPILNINGGYQYA